MTAPTTAELTTRLHELIPLAGHLGVEVTAAGRGHASVALALNPQSQNFLGTMYAGSLFSIAEIAGGVLVQGTWGLDRYYLLLRNISLRFSAPTASDAIASAHLAETEIDRLERDVAANGKSNFMLPMEIRDADGRITVTAEADFQLRPTAAR